MELAHGARRRAARPRPSVAVPQPRGPRPSHESRAARGRGQGGTGRRAAVVAGPLDPCGRPRRSGRRLQAQAEGRVPELVPIRNGRMLASPFAFFRGSAAVMAADLATRPSTGLRVQLCGDAHCQQLRRLCRARPPDRLRHQRLRRDAARAVGVGRRAAVREPRHRSAGSGARTTSNGADSCVAAAKAYRTAMREFAEMGNLEVWYARLTAADIIDRWGAQVGAKTQQAFERRLQKAMSKDSVRAASKLTRVVDGQQRLVNEPPLLQSDRRPADREQRAGRVRVGHVGRLAGVRADACPATAARCWSSTPTSTWGARSSASGASGRGAWVVLLRGVDDDDVLMLQLKEARQSVLAPFAGRGQVRAPGQAGGGGPAAHAGQLGHLPRLDPGTGRRRHVP